MIMPRLGGAFLKGLKMKHQFSDTALKIVAKTENDLLTWNKKKIAPNKWVVEWSDGIKTIFYTEQKALEAINNRFFDTYF